MSLGSLLLLLQAESWLPQSTLQAEARHGPDDEVSVHRGSDGLGLRLSGFRVFGVGVGF